MAHASLSPRFWGKQAQGAVLWWIFHQKKGATINHKGRGAKVGTKVKQTTWGSRLGEWPTIWGGGRWAYIGPKFGLKMISSETHKQMSGSRNWLAKRAHPSGKHIEHMSKLKICLQKGKPKNAMSLIEMNCNAPSVIAPSREHCIFGHPKKRGKSYNANQGIDDGGS